MHGKFAKLRGNVSCDREPSVVFLQVLRSKKYYYCSKLNLDGEPM